MAKRMRLPNGFGQISEIKNQRLRNRFRAMVTIGKTPEGKPICKLLKPKAYFKTYNEAYNALSEYKKNPYVLESTCTLRELYDRWYKNYEAKGRSESMLTATRLCWDYFKSLHSMSVKDIKVRHIKKCIEGDLEKKPTKFYQAKMRVLMHQLLNFAIEEELIEHNPVNDLGRVDKNPSNYTVKHTPYTDDEIAKLWNSTELVAKMVLIQCYSGWRPQELLLLKKEDVDLTNWTFEGGLKTENGIDREIPIHTKIRPLVKEAVEQADKYLFPFTGYDQYRHYFLKRMKEIGIDGHKPHDGRKHFVTVAKNKGVDEYAIKRIVGHTIKDLTERVYTERPIEWLRKEIEKI